MKVLPPEIALPAESIVRRHTPKRGAYPTYRSCLEWEFGFFCAFCFIHETDMNEHGFAGLGVMSIEHKATRSAMPDLEDDYRNCFYACRFCNRARSDRPMVSRDRRRLLDPCEVVWAHEFETANDELIPLTADAEYTHEAYDLNDPRKGRVAQE